MGIRFNCHHCESPLNVKSELASKRGVCPKCQGKFRIPVSSQTYSLALSDRDGTSNHSVVANSALVRSVQQNDANAKIQSVDKAIPDHQAVNTKKKDRGHHSSVKSSPTQSVHAEATFSTPTSAQRNVQQDGASHTVKAPKKAKPPRGSSAPFNQVSRPNVQALAESDVAPILDAPTAPDAREVFYFVRPPSGGEYGPASKATLEDWIAQRRVTADSHICKLGESEWLKAEDVFAVQFLFRK
jgi:GYF domain 2